jgi:hypothetical protein
MTDFDFRLPPRTRAYRTSDFYLPSAQAFYRKDEACSVGRIQVLHLSLPGHVLYSEIEQQEHPFE